AIAICKYIRDKGGEILYVGGTGGLEERLVPREGFEIKTVEIKGFRRNLSLKGTAYNLRVLHMALRSLKVAKKYIKEFRPDVVIGCGGYASFPVVYAAQKLKIPTAILEVNAYAGVTTKVLSKKADVIMVGFEAARDKIKSDKVVMTGNPVRADILTANRDEARRTLSPDDKPLILSVWGSLGAEKMNRMMADFIALEAKSGEHRLIHAIGSYGYKWMPELIRERGVNLEKCDNIDVRDYIYDMANVMSASDVVLCRAGAATMAELACMGKPAIIVPSPNVAENHQEKNARALEEKGAAMVLLERDIDGKKLYEETVKLLSDKERLRSMSEAMKSLASPDAIDKIYRAIEVVVK
ncbi:MAG: undecaprenyldiphospho-muramoylpentapeptide beta-N-acetylglucosaminyltransferase, partial [Clostridiales bacterium]|nr:undecaprenyldiphospho-muramoylpentapeptide beta-N-acetylglucosaminyltransferase [Clostridiales bacterium]